MPGTRCAVTVCNNSYVKAKKDKTPISFHSFPKDEKLREAWIVACTRKDPFNPSTSYICNQHFKEDDFEQDLRARLMNIRVKRKLKKNAVPAICLMKVEGNSKCQGRATKRRRNGNIVRNVVKSEFVAVPEFHEDTWEEKYVQLLQNHNVLKEKYQKLHETNKLQNMEIDKLKKCLSEVVSIRNLNEASIKVIIVQDENK